MFRTQGAASKSCWRRRLCADGMLVISRAIPSFVSYLIQCYFFFCCLPICLASALHKLLAFLYVRTRTPGPLNDEPARCVLLVG
jgi:hypothetical protein